MKKKTKSQKSVSGVVIIGDAQDSNQELFGGAGAGGEKNLNWVVEHNVFEN